MASPAKPVTVVMVEGSIGSKVPVKKVPAKTADEPIYLRHRFHGELGQLLRDYYADVLDQPLPEHLLRLIEQFRRKERS